MIWLINCSLGVKQQSQGCRGCMVVGFITTYAISAYDH